MLDPWIIDEILKREKREWEEQYRERVSVEVPLEPLPSTPASEPREERGVVVIDLATAQRLVDEGKRDAAEYRKRVRKMWDVR